MVRNGHEAKLGTSLFANSATQHLYERNGNEKFVGKVGQDGEFAWVLKPGTYRVSGIGFYNRGEKVEPVTDFTFDVPANERQSTCGRLRWRRVSIPVISA